MLKPCVLSLRSARGKNIEDLGVSPVVGYLSLYHSLEISQFKQFF